MDEEIAKRISEGRLRNIIFRDEKYFLVGVEDGPIITAATFEHKGHITPEFILKENGQIVSYPRNIMVGVKSHIKFLDLP